MTSSTRSVGAHLIGLPGSDWSLWRCAGLRAAGFEADLVLQLAAPDTARLIDRLLEAVHAEARARREAIEALRVALQDADAEHRPRVNKALKRLRAARLAESTGIAAIDTQLDALGPLRERVEAARTELDPMFTAATARISAVLREVARDPRFREALAWQNRGAIGRALDPLLRADEDTRARDQRRSEDLIATYLQRYATKNDTIGFFGPIGWATFSELEAGVVARPGPGLVSHRAVHFEHWAVEALAEAIASDARLQPELAPRLHTFVRIDGAHVQSAMTGEHELPTHLLELLRACTGERSARSVAATMVRMHGAAFADEAAVFAALRELRERKLVAWTLELAMSPDAFDRLREIVSGIEGSPARDAAVAMVAELEEARARVAASAGDHVALERALAELEEAFVRLTGSGPTRNAGVTYGARGLVYEDTRRDLDVVIGRKVIDALAPPLSLLLESARWLTHQFGQACGAALHRFHELAARRAGSDTVPMSEIWFSLQRWLFGAKERPLDAQVAELQRRWGTLLPIPAGARRVAFTSEQLRDGVARQFAAPGPGWPEARYHAPDVMIAAAGIDAFARGDFELVLGELHLAKNTLEPALWIMEHPRPEDLLAATILDVPEPRVAPIAPRDWIGATVRGTPALFTAKDYFLETSLERAPRSAARVLAIGDLVVTLDGAALVVRSRNDEVMMPLLDFLGYQLSRTFARARFRMLPDAAHQPRVTIDRVIVQRETWMVRPSETGLDGKLSELELFVAARRWARATDLPRFVYVKSPLEPKPVFVDLESPAYVSHLARLVRAATTNVSGEVPIFVSEMLPGLDQLWLPSAEGKTYTSELRIIAVDPLAPVRG